MALIRANWAQLGDGRHQLRFNSERDLHEAEDIIRRIQGLKVDQTHSGLSGVNLLVFHPSVTYEDIEAKLRDKLALE